MNLLNIGKGHVFHSRKEGNRNQFRYPTFFIYFRCDQVDELKDLLRKKYHPFVSFSARDYLKGEDGNLEQNIKLFLKNNCDYAVDEVWLHTIPRMFGFVFNPVNFWFCKNKGILTAVLVEVNNTFGERHFYWIRSNEEITNEKWYRAEKVFHVSPFFPVNGFYQFRFQFKKDDLRVDINYHATNESLRLATQVVGKLTELKDDSAVGLFRQYGWMTPLIVIRIHYQALKIYFKGSRFYRKPALPPQEVTYERFIR